MKPRILSAAKLSLPLAMALAAALAPNSTKAQDTATWTGSSDSLWSTSGNWSGGFVPNGNDGINIAGSSNTTMNNDLTGGALNQYRLLFNSGAGAFTLGGNALSFFNFGGNAPKIENNSSSTQTINLAVTLDGSGSGNAAEINPTDGNLAFGSTVDLAGTTQLRIWGNNGKTVTFDGIISSSGNGGANSLAINQNSTVIFGAANSYSGDTFINAGTLQFTPTGSANNSTIRLGDTIANSPAANFSLASGASSSSTIVVRPSSSGTQGTRTIGSLATSGTSTFSGSIYQDADLTTSSLSGGTLAFTGTAFDLKNQTLTVGGAGDTTISNALQNSTGSGKLTKQGSGTLTLSGANSYTGLTTINLGTVKLGAAGDGTNSALGTIAAGTSVTSGGALDLNGITLSTAEALSIIGTGVNSTGALTNSGAAANYSGIVTIGTGGASIGGSGNITLTSALATNANALTKVGLGTLTLSTLSSRTGTVAISEGTLKVGASGAMGTSTTAVTVSGTGALDLNGVNYAIASALSISGTGVSSTGALTNSGAAATYAGAVTIGAAGTSIGGSGDITLSAALGTSSNSFVKKGNGSLILTANSTAYTGEISIDSGVLRAGGGNSTSNLGAGTLKLNGGTLELRTTHTSGINYGRNTTITANSKITSDRSASNAGFTYTLGTLGIGSNTLTAEAGSNATGSTAGLTFGVTTLSGNPVFNVGFGSGSATGMTLTLGALGDGGVARTITKQGTGALTLNTLASSLVAGTQITIEGGTINQGATNALGTNSPALSITPTTGTGLYNISGAFTQTLGLMTLGGASGTTANITLSNTSAVLTMGGNLTYDATSNPNGSTISGTSSASLNVGTTQKTFNIGDSSAAANDLTISSLITNGAGGSILKTGAGTLVLSGASTAYTGGIALNQGLLVGSVAGSFGTSSSIVTFGGGSLELRAAATTFTGGLNMTGSGAAITINPASLNNGVTHIISGAATLGGNQTMSISAGSLTNANTAYGLTLSGNKTLSGDSTYTINGNGNTATLSLITGSIDLDGGTRTLTINSGSGTGTRTASISGAFTGSTGTLVLAGSAPVTVGALTTSANAIQVNSTTGGVYTFNGNSTFTGGVTLTSGTININSTGTAGTNGPLGNSATANTGNTFAINGGVIDNTSGSAKVVANVNPITVGGNFAFSTAGGTANNNLTLPGTVNLGGSTRTITTNGAGTLSLSGIISNGGLTKDGTGALTLSGTNTFTGGVTLTAGTLNINSAGTAGTNGPLGNSATANTGNTFAINGGVIDNTSGSAKVVLNVNPITIGGNFAFSTGSGTASNNLTLPGTVDLGGVTRTITTNGAAATTLSLTGLISNGGLTKDGTGTLTLSNNGNSYAGTTTINGGILNLAAGLAGGLALSGSSAAVTLSQGATLALNPSVAGLFNLYTVAVPITLSGGAGTASIRVGGNDVKVNLSGGVTGQSGVAQTLAISQGLTATGATTGGDRQDIHFSGAIADGGSGGTVAVTVDFAGGSAAAQNAFVNLSGLNTFTGNLTVTNSKGLNGGTPVTGGWLTIGGERLSTGLTVGSGYLGGGNYAGIISISAGAGLTTLSYASSATQTLSGQIIGTGALSMDGTGGTLVLSNTNSYSGTTTVSNGTLRLANQLAAQNSTLTMNGGTAALEFDSSVVGNAFTIGGLAASTAGSGYNIALENSGSTAIALTVGGNNASTTYAGLLSGGGSLTKTGSGTLTLSNASNSYSGGTVLNGGTIAISADGNFGATTGGITVTGNSSLSYVDGLVLHANRNLTIQAGTLSLGANITLNGVLSGSGTLSLTSSDDFKFFNANNDFSGTINASTAGTTTYGLRMVSIGDGLGAGLINLGSGTNGGTFWWERASGGATTFVNRQFALSGTTGNGVIGAFGASAAESLTINKDLLITGVGNKTLTLMGSNSGDNTFAGKIGDDTGSVITVIKDSAGRWILGNATNSYTGGTQLKAGTLEFASGALGTTGNITFTGSAALRWGTGNTQNVTSRLVMGNGFTSTFDTNGNDITFGTAVGNSTTGALAKTGAGTLQLDAANTYSGTTTVSGGTLRLNNQDAVALSTLTMNGGGASLVFDGAVTGNAFTFGGLAASASGAGYNIVLENTDTEAVALTVGGNNASTTYAGALSGAGSLIKTGSGTLTLSGTSSYTGGTVISGGVVQFNADANLGDASGTITLNGGELRHSPSSTLSVSRSLILNNVAGNTFFLQGNASWTTSGNVTGDGGILFRGNPNGGVSATLNGFGNSFKGSLGLLGSGGTITVGLNSLTDSVTHAGNIAFNAGGTNSQIFRWNSTATSALTLNNRAIEFTGAGAALGTIQNANATNAITINTNLSVTGTGTKTLTLDAASGPLNVFKGNIADGSGTVAITKAGAGTWALGGTNTYSGDTNLPAIANSRLVFQGSQSLSPNTKLIFAQSGSGSSNVRFLDDGAGTINFNRPIEFGGANTSHTLGIFVGNNNTLNQGSSTGTTTGSTTQVGDITHTSTATDTSTFSINATSPDGYRLQTGTITLNNLVTRTAGATTTTILNPTTANMTVAAITMATGNTGIANDGVPVLRFDGTSSDNRFTGSITNASDYLTGQALSVQKQNTSTWILSGTGSDYTGSTAISGGTLAGIGANAFGNTSGISIAAANSSTLSLLGDSSTSFRRASDSVLYPVTTTASGATINVDQATIAGTGAKTMAIGALSLNTAINNGTNFTGANNTSLSVGTVTTGNSASGTETLTNDISGGGALTLASIAVNRTTTPTLAFAGSGNTSVTGAITEVATTALTKSGAGSLTLNGASSYSGVTTVQQGNLIAGTNAPGILGNGAFGNATSEIVLGVAGGSNDAGILIGGAFTVGRDIRTPSNNNSDTGTRVLTLGGNTAANSEFSGNIFLGTTNQAGRGVTLIAATGGQVTFSGIIQNPTGMDPTAYTVTKSGEGTVVLTNANTYTGSTAVNEGTLVVGVGGTGSITSNVTVNDGGTLGGSGTITGDVTVNGGGTHAVGNSPGLQTINGATTYNSGSIFAWDLAANLDGDTTDGGDTGTRGTHYDAVNINGSLTVQGGAIFRVIQNAGLDFADPFWEQDQQWSNIFSVTGGVTGWAANTAVAVFNLSNVNITDTISQYGSFTITGTTLNWQSSFNAIPEPTTALAGVLLAAGLLRRRRK